MLNTLPPLRRPKYVFDGLLTFLQHYQDRPEIDNWIEEQFSRVQKARARKILEDALEFPNNNLSLTELFYLAEDHGKLPIISVANLAELPGFSSGSMVSPVTTASSAAECKGSRRKRMDYSTLPAEVQGLFLQRLDLRSFFEYASASRTTWDVATNMTGKCWDDRLSCEWPRINFQQMDQRHPECTKYLNNHLGALTQRMLLTKCHVQTLVLKNRPEIELTTFGSIDTLHIRILDDFEKLVTLRELQIAPNLKPKLDYGELHPDPEIFEAIRLATDRVKFAAVDELVEYRELRLRSMEIDVDCKRRYETLDYVKGLIRDWSFGLYPAPFEVLLKVEIDEWDEALNQVFIPDLADVPEVDFVFADNNAIEWCSTSLSDGREIVIRKDTTSHYYSHLYTIKGDIIGTQITK